MSVVEFAKGGMKAGAKPGVVAAVVNAVTGNGMGGGFNGTINGKKGFGPGNNYGSLHGGKAGKLLVAGRKHRAAKANAGKALGRHAKAQATAGRAIPLPPSARQAIRDSAAAAREMQSARAEALAERAGTARVERAHATGDTRTPEQRNASAGRLWDARRIDREAATAEARPKAAVVREKVGTPAERAKAAARIREGRAIDRKAAAPAADFKPMARREVEGRGQVEVHPHHVTKLVEHDVPLSQFKKEVGDHVVPFRVTGKEGRFERVEQDRVTPLKHAEVDRAHLEKLIHDTWAKGYALGDFHADNLAYHGGKMKVLDLDALQPIHLAGFDSPNDLVRYARQHYGWDKPKGAKP